MMDAARTMTAGAVDSGEKPAVVSAIAKYNLTERMRKVINHAMDVQGGTGICLGPRNLLGRVYQAIPISITVEGANILTRSLITFGQGAIRCHPYVLKEMHAVTVNDPVQASQEFDEALFGHVGFTLSNALRTLWLGLSGARLTRVPGGKYTRRYYQQLTRMSAAFAFVSDVAMLLLGGTLKRKERLSGRLADIISHLYLASACLKRFEDQERPIEDLYLLRWCCEESLHTIQLRLLDLFRNFPNRFIGRCLNVVVFPGGHPYGIPDDRLGHKVAGLILEPSATRDRLTAGIFVNTGQDEAIGRIDYALELAADAEPVEKKLNAALRSGVLQKGDSERQLEQAVNKEIIDDSEAAVFRKAAAARREVIAVDDFPQGYWHKG
jgi:acyl-CoA dehydrogenase